VNYLLWFLLLRVERKRDRDWKCFKFTSFSSTSWRNPMLPKTCQKTICFKCAPCHKQMFMKSFRSRISRWVTVLSKCHLVDSNVEVETSTVGHNSWRKAEKALANSAGLAPRSIQCFRNEARNLPVTSSWQSCLKPRGILLWVYSHRQVFERLCIKKIGETRWNSSLQHVSYFILFGSSFYHRCTWLSSKVPKYISCKCQNRTPSNV